MKVYLDKKVIDMADNLCLGVMTIEGINNKEEQEEIKQKLKKQVELVGNTDIKEEFEGYHKILCKMGLNPKKYPVSVEALISRVQKSGELPNISPLVDLCNYISLKYKVSVGVYDIDKLKGDIGLTVLEEDGADNEKAGDVLYACEEYVCTKKWIWRQNPECRVDGSTKRALVTIDGFDECRESVESAISEMAQLIEQIYQITAFKGIIDKNYSTIKVCGFTEEELEVENQLKIILKGVQYNTSIEELKNKILEARKEGKQLTVKFGLDPSAPDIHLGHAVALRKIYQLQQLGFKAVIIIGDFTARIGDPTGKSKTRNALSGEQVEENAKTYAEQIFRIIDKSKTDLRYNSDWLGKMTFEDVIELSAKCTVARILERDDFKNRYENQTPIGLHEFFYPLMQAYDSVVIESDIELGGTDQTFNVMLGRNMQRLYGQESQSVLLMPLLVGIDGKEKMSKSLGNYVCVDESPEIMFEKIMKIPDGMIINYFNLCTDLHPNDVEKIQMRLDEGENPRDIKIELARNIVSLYHSECDAEKAEQDFVMRYQKGIATDNAVIINISKDSDNFGEALVDALMGTNEYKSKSEIRRLVQGNAVSLDDNKINSLVNIDVLNNNSIVKVGKAKFYKISIS